MWTKKLKYLIREFDFLRTYNSPFKPLKIKWYFGKTVIGTPYFLPRKWINATPKIAIKASIKHMREQRDWNKRNPKNSRTIKPFRDIYDEKMKSKFAVPKKIGFDFVSLGWKTKWTDTDYRFEWSPVWSFVFFGYQIAVTFVAPEMEHYWECWLCYTRNTDKTKSVKERLEQAKKEFPCNWTTTKNGVTEEICYWDLILKNK
jgi:hypothetical protein